MRPRPDPSAVDLDPNALRMEALVRGLGVDPAAAASALDQRAQGESFGRLVRRLGLAGDEQAAEALAAVMAADLAGAEAFQAVSDPVEGLNPSFLSDVDAVVLRVDEDAVIVAVADPDVRRIVQGVAIASRRPVHAVIAPLSLIERARSSSGAAGHAAAADRSVEDDEPSSLSAASREAPIVRLVDELIAGAARARASDLHIESYPDRVRARLRVDGVLHDWRTLAPRLSRVVISRIKIIAGLDIAERRLPQDGRARVDIDGEVFDLRVATIPSAHGEGVVIRFLAGKFTAVDLEKVGLDAESLQALRRMLRSPFGLVLVVGPTGAGKSTTLAGSLMALNQPGAKLVSIEDPIEYQIDGVTQIAVRPTIGLTFASALRAILRSDPDVIVVGELRDRETAEMATDAALTGHLVLATLHANDAAGAIPRLIDLGVDPALIRSTLRMVVAQRLVRRLCVACRAPDGEGGYRPVGCAVCDQTGYRGRTGLFELLEIDPDTAERIRPGCAASDFSEGTRVDGVHGLRAAGLARVREGVTSRDEIIRVLGP
ncbi:type II secretion system protein GspE [bacterium]|nr:type II secretion system protein GspE [bacterium]